MRTVAIALAVVIGLTQTAAQTFRGAELKTHQTFQYGRFETRVKAQWAPGTVQSFFLYWDGPNWAENQWNEIDIFEIVTSAAPNGFSRNLIFGTGAPGHQQDQGYINTPGNLDDWRTYAVEWTPDHITWIVNGQQVLTLDSSHEGVRLMNKPQKLMMNIWPPNFSIWGDNFNPNDFPFIAQYDYVKVWSYNWDNKGFDYMWGDDFDNFDYTRWVKSNNWTFDGNKCTFSWDNVFTQNGNLNLRLDWWPHQSTVADAPNFLNE